jgi:hypothetical protein
MNFVSLPLTVHKRILSYLNKKDLLRYPKVCRDFQRIFRCSQETLIRQWYYPIPIQGEDIRDLICLESKCKSIVNGNLYCSERILEQAARTMSREQIEYTEVNEDYGGCLAEYLMDFGGKREYAQRWVSFWINIPTIMNQAVCYGGKEAPFYTDVIPNMEYFILGHIVLLNVQQEKWGIRTFEELFEVLMKCKESALVKVLISQWLRNEYPTTTNDDTVILCRPSEKSLPEIHAIIEKASYYAKSDVIETLLQAFPECKLNIQGKHLKHLFSVGYTLREILERTTVDYFEEVLIRDYVVLIRETYKSSLMSYGESYATMYNYEKYIDDLPDEYIWKIVSAIFDINRYGDYFKALERLTSHKRMIKVVTSDYFLLATTLSMIDVTYDILDWFVESLPTLDHKKLLRNLNNVLAEHESITDDEAPVRRYRHSTWIKGYVEKWHHELS